MVDIDLTAIASPYHISEHQTRFLRERLRAAALAAIFAGMNISEVSRQTGISRPTIYAWMKEWNRQEPRND